MTNLEVHIRCRKALPERGRPRPRERLPEEHSSEGWMERSGTRAEPYDNYELNLLENQRFANGCPLLPYNFDDILERLELRDDFVQFHI